MSQPAIDNVTPLAAKPCTSYVSVTPELAARWLTVNTVNRSLRRAKIEQYARDMASGRWHLSNDTICFDRSGKLINGQHRLSALVKTGVTVVMLITRNMPREAMVVMDSGAGRSASDALGLDGEKQTSLLAAAAKRALLVADGRIYGDSKYQSVSHEEIRGFIAANPDLRRSVETISPLRRSIDCPPSPAVVAHWLIARREPLPADLYLERLASRSNEPDGSAVLAVDSRLRELRRSRMQVADRNFMYLLIKGWNHWARDSRVRSLNIAPRGPFRIPEPCRWQRGAA